ncbi:hypothetical protein Hypma_004934 [Hypsizygus marmoreus]|uniref:Uncharacterized protein n=1 Tax=Hypsizygus marmoreus TaxID=39966 RepID=A0A369KDD7_HYPMA|nr:hypothetical protein Hypma_004934 [Hypsizygus marmoreus]
MSHPPWPGHQPGALDGAALAAHAFLAQAQYGQLPIGTDENPFDSDEVYEEVYSQWINPDGGEDHFVPRTHPTEQPLPTHTTWQNLLDQASQHTAQHYPSCPSSYLWDEFSLIIIFIKLPALLPQAMVFLLLLLLLSGVTVLPLPQAVVLLLPRAVHLLLLL